MRISYWSSDVCSSDLESDGSLPALRERAFAIYLLTRQQQVTSNAIAAVRERLDAQYPKQWQSASVAARSEARRVGKECVRKCRSRWSTDSSKKTHVSHEYRRRQDKYIKSIKG